MFLNRYEEIGNTGDVDAITGDIIFDFFFVNAGNHSPYTLRQRFFVLTGRTSWKKIEFASYKTTSHTRVKGVCEHIEIL